MRLAMCSQDISNVQRQNYSFTGALTTQVGRINSVKIGGDFQRYTLRNYSWSNDAVFSLASLLSQNASLAPGDPNKLTPNRCSSMPA